MSIPIFTATTISLVRRSHNKGVPYVYQPTLVRGAVQKEGLEAS